MAFTEIVYGDEDALRIPNFVEECRLKSRTTEIQMEFSWVDLQNLEITS